MAPESFVCMLTERFDAKAADFIIRGLREEDLEQTVPGSSVSFVVVDGSSNFAKVNGFGGSAYNAKHVLTALKRAVKAWALAQGKVFYRYGSAQADIERGRLIASGGYQNFPKVIRATLASAHYHDVDIVNAQPTILLAIATAKGWPCKELASYVGDRNGWLHAVERGAGLSRDAAKELVLAILCGCSKSRVEAVQGEDTGCLVRLWEEAKAMQEEAWGDEEYETWKESIQRSQEARRKALGAKARGYNNEKGALLALIMQDKERQCLLSLAGFLAGKGLHMDTYIHDGGLVRKSDAYDDAGMWAVLQEARTHVEADCDVPGIDITVKPWGPVLTVPDDFDSQPIINEAGEEVEGTGTKKKKKKAGSGSKRGWPLGRKRGRRGRCVDEEAEEAEEADEDGEGDGSAKMLMPSVTKEAYEIMKAEFESNHFYYVPGNTFAEVTATGIKYYQLVHAKEYFDSRFAFGGKRNFTRRVSFLDIWRMDPTKKIIHRVDFQPSDDPTVFYLPLKFQYEQVSDEDVDGMDHAHKTRLLELFDTLVSVAAGDDDILKEYLLNWMAHMLQKPLEQPGVCIVLTGRKGVGKDTLFDMFRQWVIGEALSHNYTETRQFFDKHDTDRKDRIFLKVEECDSALFKTHAKDFRARITGKEGTINPKGKDAITFPNYARCALTANQANPLPLNDDNDPERRVVLMAVSDRLKGNFDFFNEVYNAEKGLFTPLGGKLVANLLLARNLSGWNPRLQPKNEYQDALVDVERSPEQQFIEEGWPEGVEYSANTALQKFQGFATERQLMNQQQLAACSTVSFGRTLAYFVRDKKLASRKGHAKATYYRKLACGTGAGAGAAAGAGAGTVDDDIIQFGDGAAWGAGGGGGGFHAGTVAM